MKKKVWLFLLCLFLGIIGVHRFVTKKYKSGLVYFFTGGLFIFGWIYDLVAIVRGTFIDNMDESTSKIEK